MRTDDKCLRAFIELRAFSWSPINDQWNVQLNPLATPVFRPSFCLSEFLVVHTNHDSRYFPVWPTNGDGVSRQARPLMRSWSYRRLVAYGFVCCHSSRGQRLGLLCFRKTMGAVTTAKWNHKEEQLLLRFTPGDEAKSFAWGRPLSE